ncbi:hypothetical protein [Rhodoblastus sphagnicola]|uniref:hypothetical protein n=1 Tax=Rhodoblastus sphagnicola TaxID=333368 RepID=UPI0011B008E0|nr:hypothetical protein [Rhodoblastus sphagnicola]
MRDIEDVLDRSEVQECIELVVQAFRNRAIEIMDERCAFKGGRVYGRYGPGPEFLQQRLAEVAERQCLVISEIEIVSQRIEFLFPEMDLVPAERHRARKIEIIDAICKIQRAKARQINTHDPPHVAA